MADTFNWDVIIRLATQGARGSAGEVRQVQAALDQLNREGKVTEDQVRKTTRELGKMGSAGKTSASDLKNLSSPSLRYALYDISRTATVVSVAIAGIGTAAVVASAQYERAFANVERTLEPGTYNIQALRSELLGMSREIPATFANITQVATLGNQLGIAGNQVGRFTETVTQFGAITGISVQEASLAFGQLNNLLPDVDNQFDRLGASIALVGVNSAATESQIVSVAREIAPAASAAGFAAHEVVGLSGALASLKVPPERSRSTILQFFETLNMATAEGGEKLQNFAAVVGVSASELEQMVRSGQGRSILERFIGNISASDSVAITQALEQLGLAGLRTNPTIRALAGNMELLNSTFADGERGWRENTELARQYEIIVDTLSSTWQIFLNGLMEFGAAVGNAVAPAVKTFLTLATEVLNTFTDFINTPFGQWAAGVTAGLALVVAGFAGLVGTSALAAATLSAVQRALFGLGLGGATTGVAGLASAMLGLSTATGWAASALRLFRVALISTGIGAVVVLVGTLLAAFVDLQGTALGIVDGLDQVYNSFGKWTIPLVAIPRLIYGVMQGLLALMGVSESVADLVVRGFEEVVRAGTVIGNALKIGVQNVQTFVETFLTLMANMAKKLWPVVQAALAPIAWLLQAAWKALGPLADVLETFGAGVARGFNDFDNAVNSGIAGLREFAKTLPTLDDLSNVGDPFEDWNAGGVADDVSDLSKELRTLVDYANDLQSVWSRAFDIRFSAMSAADAILKTFQELRDAAEETRRNIAGLNAEIQGLNSDIRIQEQFLSVAIQYGDTRRAEAIQANLAKLQAELADKTADLNKEQQKNNKSLTENSVAGANNRATILGLVQQYQAQIQALASSGLSSEELRLRTEQLQRDFIAQATQLGFNTNELGLYTAAFYDVTTAINNVPRSITVDFNADPAIQALNEFAAQAASAGGSVGSLFGNALGSAAEGAIRARGQRIADAMIAAANSALNPFSTTTSTRARPGGGSFASGGFTGRGGKFEPAGVVHRGEYVVPKHMVNQRTGLPYSDAMGRLQRGAPGRSGYSGGGFVTGGNSNNGHIASFGPMAQMQLQQALQHTLNMDGALVASSVGRQNALGTSVGSR